MLDVFLAPFERIAGIVTHAIEQLAKEKIEVAQERFHAAYVGQRDTEIASILARTPTTSAELSRSLKVSKPTITHHVHALRSAGLITETPSGGSTKLTLSRETVAALSDVAVEQLFSSTGDLALDTTRKRRPS